MPIGKEKKVKSQHYRVIKEYVAVHRAAAPSAKARSFVTHFLSHRVLVVVVLQILVSFTLSVSCVPGEMLLRNVEWQTERGPV